MPKFRYDPQSTVTEDQKKNEDEKFVGKDKTW